MSTVEVSKFKCFQQEVLKSYLVLVYDDDASNKISILVVLIQLCLLCLAHSRCGLAQI